MIPPPDYFWDERPEIHILFNRAQRSHKLALPEGYDHSATWASDTGRQHPLAHGMSPDDMSPVATNQGAVRP